jgi:hypothetical protein
MSKPIPGKYYLARFKGYKRDKAWKHPYLCRVIRRFPLTPKLADMLQMVPMDVSWWHDENESSNPENFEIVKVFTEAEIKAYVNIEPVSDMPLENKRLNVPMEPTGFEYGIQSSEWETRSYS